MGGGPPWHVEEGRTVRQADEREEMKIGCTGIREVGVEVNMEAAWQAEVRVNNRR